MCSKLTTKSTELRRLRVSSVSIINFEKVNVSWVNASQIYL